MELTHKRILLKQKKKKSKRKKKGKTREKKKKYFLKEGLRIERKGFVGYCFRIFKSLFVCVVYDITFLLSEL